jgi:plasmid replication initiation protein
VVELSRGSEVRLHMLRLFDIAKQASIALAYAPLLGIMHHVNHQAIHVEADKKVQRPRDVAQQ